MARKRMIDPNIWASEDFSKLSTLAKLVFIGLFSNADDEGRGRAKPAYLKSIIFPYDEEIQNIDIEKALSEIGSNMSVTFYSNNGNDYYILDNWSKWQKVDRPTPSMIPALDEHSTIIRRTLDDYLTNTRRVFAPNRIEQNRIEKNKREEEAEEKEEEKSIAIKNDSIAIEKNNNAITKPSEKMANDSKVKESIRKESKVKEKKVDSSAANWIAEYESNIGLITPMVVEAIDSYELSDEVVIEAIKEAVKSGVRMPKYICRILEDFKANNIKTKADVEARRIERSRLHNKDKPTSAYVNPVQIQNEYGDLDRFYANRD